MSSINIAHIVVGLAFLSLPQPTYCQSREAFQASLQCCLDSGVTRRCADNLCQPPTDWDDQFVLEVNDLVDQCAGQLGQIGLCLSRGRNSSSCCREKSDSAHHVCHHMCSGEPLTIDVSRKHRQNFEVYVVCMTFDFQSNLRCVQQSHARQAPSPPGGPSVDRTVKRAREGGQGGPTAAPHLVWVKGVRGRASVLLAWNLAGRNFVVHWRRSDVTGGHWRRLAATGREATLAPLAKGASYQALVQTTDAFLGGDRSATLHFRT